MFLRSVRLISSTTAPLPWFVHPPPAQSPLPPSRTPPVPPDAPHIIKHLHSHLVKSPLLEKSNLLVSSAVLPEMGPPLPFRKPQGKRSRGGTYPGKSDYEAVNGGIWDWVVMTQVIEGTESRGAIESVVRLVRKTLTPQVVLPSNSRKKNDSEWYMVDAGSFVVHILSKSARDRYFSKTTDW